MTKPYHSISNRAGLTLKWGLLAIFVLAVVAYFPNDRRAIESQVTSMAAAVSHHGSTVSAAWLNGLSSSIHEQCSPDKTIVNVDGVMNETLTQTQIIEGVTQVASNSTDFSVKLAELSIDIARESNRAQVNADAVIEITHEGRLDREKRHVRLIMEKMDKKYRLVSVDASAPIVNQPEPRP